MVIDHKTIHRARAQPKGSHTSGECQVAGGVLRARRAQPLKVGSVYDIPIIITQAYKQYSLLVRA